MFFQWHGQIFAGALGRSLIVKSFHSFFGPLHRRSTWRGKKQMRNDTANDCAVKIFVVRQIDQSRKNGGTGHRELDGPLAKAFLKLIKIDIEPSARIADDDERFWFNSATSERPKIFIIIERRTVAE